VIILVTILCRRHPIIDTKHHILVRDARPHDERVGACQDASEFLFGGTVHAVVAFRADVFEEGAPVKGPFVRDKDGFVDGAEVEAVGGAEDATEGVGFMPPK
jgi:hypothetical protein